MNLHPTRCFSPTASPRPTASSHLPLVLKKMHKLRKIKMRKSVINH